MKHLKCTKLKYSDELMLPQVQTKLLSLSQRQLMQCVQIKQAKEQELCLEDHWINSKQEVLFKSKIYILKKTKKTKTCSVSGTIKKKIQFL